MGDPQEIMPCGARQGLAFDVAVAEVSDRLSVAASGIFASGFGESASSKPMVPLEALLDQPGYVLGNCYTNRPRGLRRFASQISVARH